MFITSNCISFYLSRFYLPRDYRQLIHHYVDLKQLLTGRVPFKVAAEDEVVIHAFSADSTLQANSELYLVCNLRFPSINCNLHAFIFMCPFYAFVGVWRLARSSVLLHSESAYLCGKCCNYMWIEWHSELHDFSISSSPFQVRQVC